MNHEIEIIKAVNLLTDNESAYVQDIVSYDFRTCKLSHQKYLLKFETHFLN